MVEPDGSARVARLLPGWEGEDGATLAERLSVAIVELIRQGELPAGVRVPSERHLAEALAVSRGTVTAAYGHLRCERWIESRVGSGSRVLAIRGRPAADESRVDARLNTFNARDRGHVDLTSGTLAGLDLTADVALAALRERLPELTRGDGYEPQGLPELRREVARYYDLLGAPSSPDQVAITTGSQQALQLVADAFVAPGDTVVVEDPTYRGALDVFRSRGARLVPVPLAADGPDTAALARVVQRLRPRIVYLLPSVHNPTGQVVSPAKARAIASILAASQTLFVEDGSPADLVLDLPRPPTPVGVGLPADRWIALGSTSKLFWGGLRIGWVRGSAALVRRIARIKGIADLGTSLVSQAAGVACLQVADRARSERRRQLLERLELVEGLLHELAPEWSWERPRGGSALWLRMPGTDTRTFAELARRRGVSIVPGPVFSAVDGFADYVRVPFGGDADELRVGVERLVDTWRDLPAGHGVRGRPAQAPT